jgi:hypothetical protein
VRVPRGSVVLQCCCMPGSTSSTCAPAHLQDDSVRALRRWPIPIPPSSSHSLRRTACCYPQAANSAPADDRRSSGSSTNLTSTITNLFYCHHYLLLTRLVQLLVHSLKESRLSQPGGLLTHWLARWLFIRS